MVFCPKCGKENPDDADFCNYCRYDLKKIKEVTKDQATVINPEVEKHIPTKSDSPPPPSYSEPTQTPTNNFTKIVGIIIIVLVVIIGGWYLTNSKGGNNNIPFIPQQYKNTIFSGSVLVNSNSYVYYTFSIPTSASNAILSGSFTASGGSGNDIKVYVMSQTDFTNWKNGHAANAYYQSGQKTTGNLNVSLPVGDYVLAFDNTFSLITKKNVSGQIVLTYTK